MSANFTVSLKPRESFGSNSSRRLRRAGSVPVVVYGANQENEHFSTSHNDLMHNLAIEAFHSAVIDIDTGSKKGFQAILREIQMHPYRPQVLHADFQRIKATEVITLRVPVHFIGDDVAPGVKNQGGIFSRLMLDVEIQCLPKDLPEYIEVDVSALELNQSVHLSDIVLPPDVELATAAEDADDYAIASILPARISTVDVEEEAEDEFAEEEGVVEEEQE